MKRLLFYAATLLFAVDVFAGDGKIRRADRPVPNQYIVVFNEDAAGPDIPAVAAEIAQEHAGRVHSVFERAFKGFLIEMPEGRALAMSHDPRIDFVEENGWMSLSATRSLDEMQWNLDRIDQVYPGRDYIFSYSTTGAGVKAYIIDSGIIASHPEFQATRNGVTTSRVVRGVNTAPNDGINDPLSPCGSSSGNCQHGTWVASVLGGKNVGVAPDVSLVAVRVFNRYTDGTVGDIVEGIEWILSDHLAYPGPAVANMSIFRFLPAYTPPSGYPLITEEDVVSLEIAVNRMIDAGITVTASANNENIDACKQTPSRIPRVITVGGTMIVNGRDTRWIDPGTTSPGSNYGTCVDIFAPAYKIKVAAKGDVYRNDLSGTSFAAPTVAGVAALHLQNATTATPNDVWYTLQNNANVGRLAGGINPLNGSPDRLIYSNWFKHAPSYEGYLDVASCRMIHGWAWDGNQPNSPINVEIYAGTGVSTTRLATLWANSYRADLVSASKGNGYHGYGFGTPPSVKDGKFHSITAKYAGTDTNLFSAPKSLICGARIFSSTPPPTENVLTGGLYTVGTQFSSNRSGYITELGFYRAPNETGSNILKLWTDSGAEITTKTASCTSTGWCWVDIPDVAISAGTRYRVSATVNTDHSKTGCGIGSGIFNDPLTAHSGFWVAGNAFPTRGSCSNFFVDVKFDM